MAKGHVDVNERRLRPIYDALDNGNNKKALQEADKLLKKQKDLTCAKALKALALLRLGRTTESQCISNEVHALSPTDEGTLQAVSICYREMNKLDMIADLYEKAAQSDPSNEDILSTLFMSYVRLHKYKEQQHVAMKLHKLQPKKNPYYFWGIMSILMQAQEADPTLASGMLMPLAERMAGKYYTERRMEAEAEVQLYLMILEMTKQYDKALEVIRGEYRDKLTSFRGFCETKELEYLVKLEKWPEANVILRTLLKDEPDQWQYYQKYIHSVLQMVDQEYTPPSEQSSETDKSDLPTPDSQVDYTLHKAMTFLTGQVENLKCSTYRLRGPSLAVIDFASELLQREKGEYELMCLGDFSDLLMNYVDQFGSKQCCYADLSGYMYLLAKDQRLQFAADLLSKYSDDGRMVYPFDLQRYLTALQLAHHCGLHQDMSVEQKTQQVRDLVKMYKATIDLDKTVYASADYSTCDQFIQMAAYLLHDLASVTDSQTYLWWAITVLEFCRGHNQANYQIKLLLLHTYCALGSFGLCPLLYDQMDIKHLQHDSLGYLVANHILRLGHMSSACTLYETMLRFYSISHKDTTEYLLQSYKFGSFRKVLEFVQLRDRLKFSFQYASAKTERMLLDLTMDTVDHQGTARVMAYLEICPQDLGLFPLQTLVDNRDVFVCSSWEVPERSVSNQTRKQSFEEEIQWIQIRNLVLRILATCVQVKVPACSGGNGAPETTAAEENNGDKVDTEDGGGDTLHRSEKHDCESCLSHSMLKLNIHSHNSTPMDQVLQALTQELAGVAEECRKNLPLPQYPVSGPYRTRLPTFLALGLPERLRDIVTLLLSIVQGKEDLKGECNTVMAGISGLLGSIQPTVLDHPPEGKLKIHTDRLETAVHIAEFLAHSVLVLGALQQHDRQQQHTNTTATTAGKKKKKKPVEPGVKPWYYEDCEQVRRCLEDNSNLLLNLFIELETQSVEEMKGRGENVGELLGILVENVPLCDGMANEIRCGLINSFRAGAREMQTFVQHKMKYLNTICFT